MDIKDLNRLVPTFFFFFFFGLGGGAALLIGKMVQASVPCIASQKLQTLAASHPYVLRACLNLSVAP